MKTSRQALIITVTFCGLSLLLPSCETYKYMRDPDAPERAQSLERSALLAEAESDIPPEEFSMDGMPYSGPAAFYDDFPEGTNPTASTLFPEQENTSSENRGEFERWVHGPDGLLVPASSLEKSDTTEAATDADSTPEPATVEGNEPQNPTPPPE